MSAEATSVQALRRRPIWLAWGAMLLVLLGFCPGPARAADQPRETAVEAAYLINFLRYTQWPASSFSSASSPYVVTVVGSTDVAASVRAVAAAASQVGGRPVEVRWLPSARGSLATPFESQQDRQALATIRNSHLVFFHESAGAIRDRALMDLWGRAVLTVSDTPGFTEAGGMLGLFKSSGHIVFEANPVAIRNSRLVVSAKVLKLARASRRVQQ